MSSAVRRPAVHLFEPNPLGHRAFFLRWLLERAPADREWVLHTRPAVLAHPALRDLLRRPPDNVHVMPFAQALEEPTQGGVVRLVLYQVRKAMAYSRRWRRVAADGDVAFIPFVDDVVFALALVPAWTSGVRLAAIGMRGTFFHRHQELSSDGGRLAAVKEYLLKRLLMRRGLRRYLTNQLPLKHYVDACWGPLARKVRFYGDPAEPALPLGKSAARAQLAVPGDRRYVLCFGSLTARKGVALLLDLVSHPAWPRDCTAIFAGAFRDDVRPRLRGQRTASLVAAGLVQLLEGFIDSEREQRLFQAADLVWLAYDYAGMSGCLVQAGMHARPIIACRGGVIGWYRKRFELGLSLGADDDPASFLAQLSSSIHDDGWLASHGARAHDALGSHTVPMFRAAIHGALAASASICP